MAHNFIHLTWKAKGRRWMAFVAKQTLCFGSLECSDKRQWVPVYLLHGSCLMIFYWHNNACFILDNERKSNSHLAALLEISLERKEIRWVYKVKRVFFLAIVIFLHWKAGSAAKVYNHWENPCRSTYMASNIQAWLFHILLQWGEMYKQKKLCYTRNFAGINWFSSS